MRIRLLRAYGDWRGEPLWLGQSTGRLMACRPFFLLLSVGLDVFDCVLYGADLLGLIIGNSDAKFFLKFHDELYSVEAVCAKILSEFSGFGYFVLVNTELINDDSFNSRCNFRHSFVVIVS